MIGTIPPGSQEEAVVYPDALTLPEATTLDAACPCTVPSGSLSYEHYHQCFSEKPAAKI